MFPLLFALALARKGRKVTRWALIGLALASSAWMAIRFEEFTDPSNVYYSTFTRASGLLLGAVLALRSRHTTNQRQPRRGEMCRRSHCAGSPSASAA